MKFVKLGAAYYGIVGVERKMELTFVKLGAAYYGMWQSMITLVSNWEHFPFLLYDDPRSQKYGHFGRVSKIREWKMFRIVQYTC